MRHATNIGRLKILAVGLGIGAALATTPGVAAADWVTDLTPSELAQLDQLLVQLFDPTGADIQVSIDGHDLFATAGNTATATSGTGDIAIAVGSGANASANGGIFDFIPGSNDVAFADGTNSTAVTGLGASFSVAFAQGENSVADAGLGANFDIASAVGSGSHAEVGVGGSLDTAFADGVDSAANVGLGNGNLAYAHGTESIATAGVGNGNLAFAGFGSHASAGGFSTAAFANGGGTATTEGGAYDLATADGTNVTALANGTFDSASASGTNAEADAVNGFSDFASVFNTGSVFDHAVAGGTSTALLGDNDIAIIIGTGSTAFAGSDPTTAGEFDLAAVFGDMLKAIATGADFLFNIQ